MSKRTPVWGLCENELHRNGEFVCFFNVDHSLDGEAFKQHVYRSALGLGRMIECANACEGIEDPSVVPEMLAFLKKWQSYNIEGSWKECDTYTEELEVIIAKAEGRK